jgi:RNA polymerase sigma-70 factor (ECF subfamily)
VHCVGQALRAARLQPVARLVQIRRFAEDLTQDAFLKMFRGLAQYDASLRFSSWLFRIAHNTAIDQLRQRRVLLATPRVDEDGEEMDRWRVSPISR